MSKPPNIIWICTDQQRSDSLGCYGNQQANTPNIDAIARAGARFTRHITPMQICSPSRATMFTGLYPRHHELITNGRALDASVPTLTGLLADAGYRTHSVGKQHLQPILAPSELNMPDSRAFWDNPDNHTWTGPYYGFQSVDLLLGESDTAAQSGHYANWLKATAPEMVEKLKPALSQEAPPADLDEIWQCALPEVLHYNTWITDRACDFIQKADSQRPFFLFVSFPDPHHPFDPLPDYAKRHDFARMPLPRVDAGELERLPEYYSQLFPVDAGFRELYWAGAPNLEAGSMIPTAQISDASMRKAIAYTHAMIEMIDGCVGRLSEAITASGAGEDTVLLFTSDHGELLGSHGLLHKGPPSYKQLVEVSMIMQGPGIRANHVEDALTSHIDLAPTFLEIAGVSASGGQFDGQSLMPLLSGDGVWQRDASYGEYHPTTDERLYNQTIRTKAWRLSVYPLQPRWGELFDLNNDPNEHCNLYNNENYAEIQKSLSEQLTEAFAPQPTVNNPMLCKW